MQIVTRKEAKAAGLKRYFNGLLCKHGHLDERVTSSGVCLTCQRDLNAKNYSDPSKRAKVLGRMRANYAQPSEKQRIAEKNSDPEVKAARMKYAQEYRARPDSKKRQAINNARLDVKIAKAEADERRKQCPDAMARRRERERERYSTPSGRSRNAMRRMLKRCIKSKHQRTHEILGYSPDDLRRHIERQFAKGMTWDNMGDWHIDHITPIQYFLEIGETSPAVINALPNLMPIWAAENLSKGAKVTCLL